MSWVKIDDQFTQHPKVHRLSDKAFRVHMDALCYCARFLTDGHVPASYVTGVRKPVLAELTRDLWKPVQDGYVIHDFLDYNPSRKQVEEMKTAKARAGRIGGRRSSKRQAPELADVWANV